MDFESGAMVRFRSTEAEVIPFETPLTPRGNVEQWLLELQTQMKKSVRLQVKKAMLDYPKPATSSADGPGVSSDQSPSVPAETLTRRRSSLTLSRRNSQPGGRRVSLFFASDPTMTPPQSREEWILRWPGQAVLAVSQIFWTSDCENALQAHGAAGLKALVQALHKQLLGVVGLVQAERPAAVTLNLGALITIELHARDVVEQMASQGVAQTTNFHWMSQLRFLAELAFD